MNRAWAHGTHNAPPPPPLFPTREGDRPWSEKKKKKNKLDRHIRGNSRPSMLLNFNVNFVTFFETALDAIWLLKLILRLEATIKG